MLLYVFYAVLMLRYSYTVRWICREKELAKRESRVRWISPKWVVSKFYVTFLPGVRVAYDFTP